MEVLELDGKRYVKASKAAREAGYTADYVGQLCRAGKVPAHLVGRSWYVDTDQLGTHRVEKKRSSRLKAREQVRKAIEEQTKTVESGNKKSHFLRRVAEKSVEYSPDEHELIPAVRKLEISTEKEVVETPKKATKTSKKKVKKPIVKSIDADEDDKNYIIEHEGDKIVMSGSINVVDVTDNPFAEHEEGSVLLEPTILTSKELNKKKTVAKKPKKKLSQKLKIAPHQLSEEKPVKSTFEQKLVNMERLERSEDVLADRGAQKMHQEIALTEVVEDTGAHGSRIPIISIGLSVAIVALTLMSFVESQWSYSTELTEQGSRQSVTSNYAFDYKTLFAQIPFK